MPRYCATLRLQYRTRTSDLGKPAQPLTIKIATRSPGNIPVSGQHWGRGGKGGGGSTLAVLLPQSVVLWHKDPPCPEHTKKFNTQLWRTHACVRQTNACRPHPHAERPGSPRRSWWRAAPSMKIRSPRFVMSLVGSCLGGPPRVRGSRAKGESNEQ